MPSLVPGYGYDIFISYRQKDNRGGHWVTEFVRSLKTELDATFKEDISIYFDENPYDGLLETLYRRIKSRNTSVRGLLMTLVNGHEDQITSGYSKQYGQRIPRASQNIATGLFIAQRRLCTGWKSPVTGKQSKGDRTTKGRSHERCFMDKGY